MTSWLFACTWFLPLSILATLSNGELEFYPDAVPETSQDITLKQLARFLESHRQRGYHRTRISPLLPSHVYKKHYLEWSRQQRRDILEALKEKFLPEKSRLSDSKKQREWEHFEFDDPINEELRRELDLRPLYEGKGLSKNVEEYPGIKLSYPIDKVQDDSVNYKEQLAYLQEILSKQSPYNSIMEKGLKETFHEGHFGRGQSDRDSLHHRTPEFTFKFDPPDLEDKHPFAVKPNDPRYYQDLPFSVDDDEDDDESEESSDEDVNSEKDKTRLEKNTDIEELQNVNGGIQGKFKEILTDSTTESDRYTEYHPFVVPVDHTLNNDIYFIAIVAGCSAAAMFALVLISLTWCRLQRGVKAAADIEYPAYGVTGPNKDVSPSGDQRLAQSAQMYHFQHQKQQIIAMENRTSATRDPGSVSEAESDEENEEGDYTVYECPGLASTGEMEVKNPLFHDDPTPATPAQTNKEEDHI